MKEGQLWGFPFPDVPDVPDVLDADLLIDISLALQTRVWLSSLNLERQN